MTTLAFKKGVLKTKDKRVIGMLQSSPLNADNAPKDYPPEVSWIKDHKHILNLKSVAEEIGMPVKNLWNYCNDIHSLNEKWWAAAVKWVRKLRVFV